ncbi:septum site-determining protein MinC [Guptibacillus algicola]|uniref:septum site-determining protein MinC n=1 Tax=Guptibacillus algicola TaxID=225844 RepID=UPI001CD49FEC|nr:septum site-determining protein MinC [Alkalihalobacillus algicola]MCA0986212.1 septum site-determining protein MinC [Alkalihalobacillus algicola]
MAQKQSQHYVTIKGTKDGLNLILDDSCAFRDVINDLDDKLSARHIQQTEGQTVTVTIKVGNRYLTDEQEDSLREIIQEKQNLEVDRIDSNVISRDEAEEERKRTTVKSVARTVRSGQVLEVEGDLLLIGDVNPGGTVMAGGNIFVMGTLRGIAHAGAYGNNDAVITASLLKPSQLRIADLISRPPDQTGIADAEAECAYIKEGTEISVDRVQILTKIRPNLTRL